MKLNYQKPLVPFQKFSGISLAGPTWNKKEKRQNILHKPAQSAYENLKAIIRSRQLNLGNYLEVVKVILPELTKYDWSNEQIVVKKNVSVEIESSPICCLSDIPAPHLRYHASRVTGNLQSVFIAMQLLNQASTPCFIHLTILPL